MRGGRVFGGGATSVTSSPGRRTTNLLSVGDGTNASLIIAAIGAATVPARFAYGYNSNGAATVKIPDDPVTTNTSNVTNQTELDAAIALGSNRRINVANGSYNSIGLFADQTDLDFQLQPSAIFSGGANVGHSSGNTSTRIRFAGGQFGGALFIIADSSHVMAYNTKFFNAEFNTIGGTGLINHIGIVNTDFLRTDGGFTHLGFLQDAVIANCVIGNTSGSAATVRAGGQRIIYARNWITHGAGNRVVRLHADDSWGDTDLVLYTGNQLEGPDNIVMSPYQGVAVTVGLRRVEWHGNTYYNVSSGTSGYVMQIDADQGSGVDDFRYFDNTNYSPDTAIDSAGVTNYAEGGNAFNAYQTPSTPSWNPGADH